MSPQVRIGPFVTERLLGHGSFATVWLARDEDLDALVAVKVLAENWSQSEEVRERFVREARMLRQIDHDRVVRVHTVGLLEDGRPYFVMEYADRGTLRDRLTMRQGTPDRFSVAEVLTIGRDIARALAVIHRADVVHRDLKPSNVLFKSIPVHHRESQAHDQPSALERLLLADFGIARASTGGSATVAAGSPGYAAPEQWDGHPVAQSDIYSAGLICAEMLAGRLPDMPAINDAGAGHWVASIRPDVPDSVIHLLDRAVAPDPTARVATAEDLAGAMDAELDSFAGQGGADAGSASGSARPAPPRSHRRRKSRGLIGAALAFAVVVAAVLWWRWDASSDSSRDAEPVATGLRSYQSTRWSTDLEVSQADAMSAGIFGSFGIAADSEAVYLTVGANLYRLDADSGHESWQRTLESADSLRAAGNGLVYIAGDGGTVTAFDAATGVPRWTHKPDTTDANVRDGWTLTALAGGHLLVTAYGLTEVHGLDARTGEVRWTYDVRPLTLEQLPELSDGPWVLDMSAGSSTAYISVWSDQGATVHVLDSASGTPKWLLDSGMDTVLPAAGEDAVYLLTAPELTQEQIAQLETGLFPGYGLVALDATLGEQRWTIPSLEFGWRDPPRSPVLANASVVVGVNANHDTVFGFDAATGSGLWTLSNPFHVSGDGLLALAGDTVYLGGEALVAVDARTGEELWRVGDGPDSYVAAAAGDNIVYTIRLPSAGATIVIEAFQ